MILRNKIQGNYLEFGVYQGVSFCRFYYLMKKYKLENMHMFAFDSFKGLPKPRISEEEIWSEGQYACCEEDFSSVMNILKVPENAYTIVKGYYNESLTSKIKDIVKKAAFVYIDCDLYASAIIALNFVTDCVQNGTLLFFDDFYFLRADPDQGERKALREWLLANPNISVSEWYNVGYKG